MAQRKTENNFMTFTAMLHPGLELLDVCPIFIILLRIQDKLYSVSYLCQDVLENTQSRKMVSLGNLMTATDSLCVAGMDGVAWSNEIEDLHVDIGEAIQDLKIAIFLQWGINECLKVT